MEYAGVIQKKESNEMLLDSLQVEKERGITVKAQSCSMRVLDDRRDPPQAYLLNLIDTPVR